MGTGYPSQQGPDGGTTAKAWSAWQNMVPAIVGCSCRESILGSEMAESMHLGGFRMQKVVKERFHERRIVAVRHSHLVLW